MSDVATALLVAAGAGIGAPLRFLVQQRVRRPWGVATVNVLGSAVLGLLSGGLSAAGGAAGGAVGWVAPALGTGLCGAFTTFSAFAAETWESLTEGRVRLAATSVLVQVVLSLLGCAAGWALGSALVGS